MSCLYMTTRRHSMSLFIVKKGKLRKSKSSDPVISASKTSTKMDPTSNDAGASLGGSDSVIAEATTENGCEASNTDNSSSMHADTSRSVCLVCWNATQNTWLAGVDGVEMLENPKICTRCFFSLSKVSRLMSIPELIIFKLKSRTAI